MLWRNPPAGAVVHRPLPTSSRRSWRSLRGGFSRCPATARKRTRVFHIPCKTPFCRKVRLPYAPPAPPLGACRTPKQLSRKCGRAWHRSGFSGAQFRYAGSHRYFVCLCNSYQEDAVAVVAVFARVATPSALNRMGVGEKRVAHPSKTEMEGHPRGFCELNAPPADGLPSCQ